MKETVIFYFIIFNYFDYAWTDMTESSFGRYKEGIIAAFGDFNSDELTDAFVINNGSNLHVYIAHDKEPFLRPSSYQCNFSDFIITSVVPGDYDGDAYMDIMITTQSIHNSGFEDIRILWGGSPNLNCSYAENIKATVKGQPLVMDYDHNMILDLFGLNTFNQRVFWIFDQTRSNPLQVPLSDDESKELKLPHSHSFIDINGDNAADLLITTKFDVELWISQPSGFVYSDRIQFPIGLEHAIFGQVLFLDVALSGQFVLVLPTCLDHECHNSTILIYDNNNWHDLKVDFNDGKGTVWRLVPPRDEYYLQTMTMRSGDFNMDGYPDILMTLSPQDSNETRLFLFHNINCGYADCKFHRTFSIQWEKFNSFGKDVVMGTFYDFYMDGVLDVIYVEKNVTTQKYTMNAFRNELEYDTNFIKVIVVTGLTNEHPPVINETLRMRTVAFGNEIGLILCFYLNRTKRNVIIMIFYFQVQIYQDQK